VISIAGGAPFVGAKKLVRIDEVKRTAAYASLISGNGVEAAADEESEVAEVAPEVEEETSDTEAKELESNGSKSKRRRGRRGGRRRSRARAPQGSESKS
jgi:hypothetical protein